MVEELNKPVRRDSALEPAPDYRLLVAGSGPLEGWLRNESARLGGRLHLLGQISTREEMARLLASADVFVHPNPREPFGIGPLEAMASGTPLIAPNAGGVLDYANRDCAWLAEPDGHSFARAAQDVFANPLRARERAERARSVAEGLAWPNAVERFFETYELCHAERLAAGHLARNVIPRPAHVYERAEKAWEFGPRA
jgi:alpha-1,6-mannosyltransferase